MSILTCKDKDEVQKKHGEHGLELYNSGIAEILNAAVKSEEAFNLALQEEKDKYKKLKDYVIEHAGSVGLTVAIADIEKTSAGPNLIIDGNGNTWISTASNTTVSI